MPRPIHTPSPLLLALMTAVTLVVAGGCEDETTKGSEAQAESTPPESDPEPSMSIEATARADAERAAGELARLGTPTNLGEAQAHFSVFAEQFRNELLSRDLDTVRSNLVTEAELDGCTRTDVGKARGADPTAEAAGDQSFAEWHAKLIKDVDEIVGRGWRYLAVEKTPELAVHPNEGEHELLAGDACKAGFIGQTTLLIVLDNRKEPHALRLQPKFALIDGTWRFVGRRFSGESLDCEDENQDEAACRIWQRERTR